MTDRQQALPWRGRHHPYYMNIAPTTPDPCNCMLYWVGWDWGWLVLEVISIVETKSNLMVTPSMFQEGSRRVGVDVSEEYERPR